jgi:hypothetical protein
MPMAYRRDLPEGATLSEGLQGPETAPQRRKTRRGKRGGKNRKKNRLKTARGQIREQKRLNKQNVQDQMDANRVNVEGPTGSSTFVQNEDGSYTQVNTLSPEQQALYDQQNQFGQQANDAAISAHDRATSALSNPYSLNNIGAENPYTKDYDAERNRIEEATYGRLTQHYDNRFDRQQQQLEQQLANQGLARGSEGWNNAMRDFNDTKQRAYSDASGQAVQMGGQEFSRAFDVAMRGRQLAISEYEGQRYAPLNELNQLAGYQQGPAGTPQAPISQASVPNVDVASIQQAQQAFNLQKQAFRDGRNVGGGGGGGFTIPAAPSVVAPPPPPPSGSSGKSGSSQALGQIGASAAGAAASGFGQSLANGLFG